MVAWLVHEDCVITGECFTVGGGYVGRVSVAINDGYRWERPLTPESVSSNWDQIMQDDNWRPLPLGRGDLDRVLKGFNP